jgi:hypothetical protein
MNENCWLNRSESTEIEKLKSQLAATAAGPGRSRAAPQRDPGTVKKFFSTAGPGPGRDRSGSRRHKSRPKKKLLESISTTIFG